MLPYREPENDEISPPALGTKQEVLVLSLVLSKVLSYYILTALVLMCFLLKIYQKHQQLYSSLLAYCLLTFIVIDGGTPLYLYLYDSPVYLARRILLSVSYNPVEFNAHKF